jgi:hypothetical protein
MPPKKCLVVFDPVTNLMTALPGSWVSVKQQATFQDKELCKKKINELLKIRVLDKIHYDINYQGLKYYIFIDSWTQPPVQLWELCCGGKHPGWKVGGAYYELTYNNTMGRSITQIYPHLLDDAKPKENAGLSFK